MPRLSFFLRDVFWLMLGVVNHGLLDFPISHPSTRPVSPGAFANLTKAMIAISRTACVVVVAVTCFGASPALAQKDKAGQKSPRLMPTALYETVLGAYFNDGKPIPFANLQVPNGKNMLSDEVLSQMRGKISIGEISYRGAAFIYVPEDGAYDIESNVGEISVNGVKLGLDRKNGRVEFRKGVYPIALYESNHGQPYLAACTLQIKNAATGEKVPLFNNGQTVQRFMNGPLAGNRPIIVADVDFQKSQLDIKLPKK